MSKVERCIHELNLNTFGETENAKESNFEEKMDLHNLKLEECAKRSVDFFPDTHTYDDLDVNFNVDNLEKKKKKKKKPFDLEEIEVALPVEDTPPVATNGPVFEFEKEEIDLDMDFSMAKKKRKSKKKDIDEFLGEKKEEDDMKIDEKDNG